VKNISGDVLVCSGPTLNNELLKAGFVKEIILKEIPVSILTGVRPFDPSLVRTEISLMKN
jgi:riboflavin biosynthesis pyrimidine reductase